MTNSSHLWIEEGSSKYSILSVSYGTENVERSLEYSDTAILPGVAMISVAFRH